MLVLDQLRSLVWRSQSVDDCATMRPTVLEIGGAEWPESNSCGRVRHVAGEFGTWLRRHSGGVMIAVSGVVVGAALLIAVPIAQAAGFDPSMCGAATEHAQGMIELAQNGWALPVVSGDTLFSIQQRLAGCLDAGTLQALNPGVADGLIAGTKLYLGEAVSSAPAVAEVVAPVVETVSSAPPAAEVFTGAQPVAQGTVPATTESGGLPLMKGGLLLLVVAMAATGKKALRQKRTRYRQTAGGRDRQYEEIEEAQRKLGRRRRGRIDSVEKSKQSSRFRRGNKVTPKEVYDEYEDW